MPSFIPNTFQSFFAGDISCVAIDKEVKCAAKDNHIIINKVHSRSEDKFSSSPLACDFYGKSYPNYSMRNNGYTAIVLSEFISSRYYDDLSRITNVINTRVKAKKPSVALTIPAKSLVYCCYDCFKKITFPSKTNIEWN